jgi:histidinol-phosphate aminotransferase
VLAAVADAAADLNRYPPAFSEDLCAAIGRLYGLEANQVVAGAGSAALIELILRTFAGPGDDVLYAWRSFEAYPISVQLSGAASVHVPLDAAARHDLDAMARALTPRTRVVILCSPNNPTGPVCGEAETRAFLQRLPSNVLVLLDEAYFEFAQAEGTANGLTLLDEHPNLIVLRTFSKAYGLAGLRCGYAIARPRLAAALRAATTPFAVSSLAQRAALVALDMQAEMRERVAAIIAQRERFAAALRAQGWNVPDTQTNFVWLPAGADAVPLAQASAAAGVMVRPFAGDGVRVSVGEPEAIDAFVEVAASWV